MAYIANNTAKHAAEYGKHLPAGCRDPYTVGYFADRVLLPPGTAAMVEKPTSWLLCHGWRRGAKPAPAAVPCPSGVAGATVAPVRRVVPAFTALPLFGQGSLLDALPIDGTSDPRSQAA